MCAVIAIRRVWNLAARVADASRDDPRSLPEEILHSPEAPSGKDRLLETFAGGAGRALVRFAYRVHDSKVATVGSRSGTRECADGARPTPGFHPSPGARGRHDRNYGSSTDSNRSASSRLARKSVCLERVAQPGAVQVTISSTCAPYRCRAV